MASARVDVQLAASAEAPAIWRFAQQVGAMPKSS